MSRYEIASALKRLRTNSGLKADEVGAMLGKSGKTVNAWENGRGQPDADTLIALSDIYGVEDILSEFRGESKRRITLSAHEVDVILAYRSHSDDQKTIDKILDIGSEVAERKKRA